MGSGAAAAVRGYRVRHRPVGTRPAGTRPHRRAVRHRRLDLLRFDPSVPDGLLHVDPQLPEWITELRLDGVPLAGSRLAVEVDGEVFHVDGLPTALTLDRRAREPLTGLRDALGRV